MTSYEVITNQIITKMEQGIIPWVKPWKDCRWRLKGEDFHRFNCYSYSNGKLYNFLNHMLLEYEAGEYATFNEIQKAGGKVKKGEHASIICGWIVENKAKQDKDGNVILDEDGNPEMEKTFALRYYRVFNILTQCEGIKPKHEWVKPKTMTKKNQHIAVEKYIEKADAIVEKYLNSKDHPTLTVKKSNKAYYSPTYDEVVIPEMKQFSTVDEYYGTLFHELTHSTMKKSRCNRKEGKNVAFGDEDYSKEELVAEIGSCFLSAQADLNSESKFRNSVAYLQNWLKALKNDPKMIVMASAQAEKSTEYILNAE